ncbi:hypothetical protein, variant 4 [Phialophora macrospora]|uniref:N-acetyltransferase domain-containing protein n=1 Tax=Phialophora macrospora TaxID=1851006 RepID=A0A0D2FTP2_9EURO|nr:hypothetical protein, variant 2 [Phialophora macrospora]KIW63425.1 hypothetical protein, variant 3 [Phialophora macrospora]KIW63426.1 hypothetical protein, variant 4 [Phialophora macrospora]
MVQCSCGSTRGSIDPNALHTRPCLGVKIRQAAAGPSMIKQTERGTIKEPVLHLGDNLHSSLYMTSPSTMPLVLQEAVEADASRIVEIERLAYASNALSPILFPGPFPPEAAAQRAEGLVKQRREDPTIRWVKVVDSETGEVAAFAKWDIIEKPKEWVPGRTFGPGCNIAACEEFFGGIRRKRHKLMGGKAYCLLDLLQADPKYQGRGAGGMLIKWGLDIADALQLPAYLESSPVAHRLYQKFGFKDIDELILSPQWNYGSENPSIYFMLREAQKA